MHRISLLLWDMRIKKNLGKFGFVSFLILLPLVSLNMTPYSGHERLQTAIMSITDLIYSDDTNLIQLGHYVPESNFTHLTLILHFDIEIWNPTNSFLFITVEKNENECFEQPFLLTINKSSYIKDTTLLNQIDIPDVIFNPCTFEHPRYDNTYVFKRGLTSISTMYYDEFLIPGNVTGMYGKLVFNLVFPGIQNISYSGTLFFDGGEDFASFFKISPNLPLNDWGNSALSIYMFIIIIDVILILFYYYKKKDNKREYSGIK